MTTGAHFFLYDPIPNFAYSIYSYIDLVWFHNKNRPDADLRLDGATFNSPLLQNWPWPSAGRPANAGGQVRGRRPWLMLESTGGGPLTPKGGKLENFLYYIMYNHIIWSGGRFGGCLARCE